MWESNAVFVAPFWIRGFVRLLILLVQFQDKTKRKVDAVVLHTQKIGGCSEAILYDKGVSSDLMLSVYTIQIIAQHEILLLGQTQWVCVFVTRHKEDVRNKICIIIYQVVLQLLQESCRGDT